MGLFLLRIFANDFLSQEVQNSTLCFYPDDELDVAQTLIPETGSYLIEKLKGCVNVNLIPMLPIKKAPPKVLSV